MSPSLLPRPLLPLLPPLLMLLMLLMAVAFFPH
jgi:hypothetical protein